MIGTIEALCLLHRAKLVLLPLKEWVMDSAALLLRVVLALLEHGASLLGYLVLAERNSVVLVELEEAGRRESDAKEPLDLINSGAEGPAFPSLQEFVVHQLCLEVLGDQLGVSFGGRRRMLWLRILIVHCVDLIRKSTVSLLESLTHLHLLVDFQIKILLVRDPSVKVLRCESDFLLSSFV